MQNSANKIIKIAPKSKRNRLFLLCLGCLLLFCCLLLNLMLWQAYKVQLILLMSASFIVLLIGSLKYLEPETSYQITPETICYYHSNGQWQLPWQDIIRIGEIKTELNGEYLQLPYIGIKLNTLENIAKSISPRLANKLIHEQKELIYLAIKNQEIELQDDLINFEPYQLNELTYKGPVAAWLYRSEQLLAAYGYHIYLPDSSFDRDLHDFFNLLRQCHHYTSSETRSGS